MYHIAVSDERTRTLLPVYLITAGHDYPQEMRSRPQGIEIHHIFVVERGLGVFESEKGRQLLEPGTAVFIPKGYPNKYYGAGEDFRTGWVTFDGRNVKEILDYFKAEPMICCPAERLNPQPLEFCRMIQRRETPERTSAELYRLIVSFFSATKGKAEPRLERIKKFIADRYHRDLSVEEIATAAGISPSLLFRLFREEGSTPVEYLRQMRIQKAKELLLQTPEKKIGDVAVECGFSDFAYFCKVFRETEGISPKAFREKYRI